MALASAKPRSPAVLATQSALIEKAERLLQGQMELYGHAWRQVGSPPDWFRDPWTGTTWAAAVNHWSTVREFPAAGTDIKSIWEMSRFSWMVLLARAYAWTGRTEFLSTLVAWLDDWIERNPGNAGVNWKCGQETSIRLLRFLEALECIEWPAEAKDPLQSFVLAHVHRIEASLSYALAQDNNHGTTEAAALYVGAQWLLVHGTEGAQAVAQRSARRAREQLVERINRLFLADGTFAQYSVNYHRMVLDTISIVEAWRRRFNSPPVFDACMERVAAGIDWLWTMADLGTGDAPNLGANDGTTLLISPGGPYRDFRPSVQLSGAFLLGKRFYGAGPWDDAVRYWGQNPEDLPFDSRARGSQVFREGGIAVLRARDGRAWGLLRVPRFKFRPGHADALHFDLWVAGMNLIRDTGSYCYNASDNWHEYFSGTRSHSTCEFDGRDQMPRIGRFLFSNWLTLSEFQLLHQDGSICGIVAAYEDHWGARHKRTVELRDSTWIVVDDMSGFQKRAVVRWHLAPGDWRLSGNRLVGSRVEMEVGDGAQAHRIRLVEGWESRAYMERTPIPILEIELAAAGTVRTVIRTLH